MKWLYKLREKWRSTAYEIQERQGFRATFPDMVCFLEKQVKVLSHPLFGDISDVRSNTLRASNASKSVPRNNVKGSSFATSISASDHAVSKSTVHRSTRQPITSKESSSESCLYCQESHSLLKCTRLIKLSQREKIEFLRGKGVCFGSYYTACPQQRQEPSIRNTCQ